MQSGYLHIVVTLSHMNFAGKKLEDICPSTHNMEVPIVVRKDFQLIDIDGEFLSLMDDSGETREDIKIPEGELGDEIKVSEGVGGGIGSKME